MHKIRNFHGHSTVGEWQGSGRVVAGLRQGNGIVCVNRPLMYALLWSEIHKDYEQEYLIH
jgi:hypothetical protein